MMDNESDISCWSDSSSSDVEESACADVSMTSVDAAPHRVSSDSSSGLRRSQYIEYSQLHTDESAEFHNGSRADYTMYDLGNSADAWSGEFEVVGRERVGSVSSLEIPMAACNVVPVVAHPADNNNGMMLPIMSPPMRRRQFQQIHNQMSHTNQGYSPSLTPPPPPPSSGHKRAPMSPMHRREKEKFQCDLCRRQFPDENNARYLEADTTHFFCCIPCGCGNRECHTPAQYAQHVLTCRYHNDHRKGSSSSGDTGNNTINNAFNANTAA